MFYAIPNLRSSVVSEVKEPWNLKTKTPPDYTQGSAKVKAWCSRYETEHAMISGYEGTAPEVRVTKDDNPPYKLHALIVDYDAPLPENPVAHLLTRRACEFLPSYLIRTASNARLVWFFEQPILYTNSSHWKAFLATLTRQLGLGKWLGGLDAPALSNPFTYYELGQEWIPVDPNSKIPHSILTLWFIQAAERAEFEEGGQISYQIPFEDMAAEIELRWPGRWRGPFIEGARGVRFWDPHADNVTAAVVTKDGMLCFTGTQAFVPWRQLFGNAWVEQYEADAISDIMKNTVYDGQLFYMQMDEGSWVSFSKPDFTQELRVRGKDPIKRKGQTASEIDIIENRVKRYNRVKAAMPFLFFPRGVISYGRDRYLNISTVRPCTPAPPLTGGNMSFLEGRKYFPLIHSVLRNMFTVEDDDEANHEQLTHLLAWLKYAYCNAHAQTPRPGHTVVIAGPPGKGKSFLSWQIISRLLGGRADAASHLVDGDAWTERLLENPVMTIDDSSALTDERSRRAFTNKVKRYTANAEMLFNQKYVKTGNVPWFGRIVITCNLDAESLMILPDMDASTADKICLFKTGDAKITAFKSWEENNKAVGQQLPMFARFLIDWPYPEHVPTDERRFGVAAYHHPDLFNAARAHGIGLLLELVSGFMEEYCDLNKVEFWEGTVAMLCSDLGVRFPQLTKDISHRGMSVQLGKAAAAGYRLFKIQERGGTSTWRIYKNIFQRLSPEERL